MSIDLPNTQAIETEFSDGWLRINFNQPENRNALTLEMVSEIKQMLSTVRDDRRVRGIAFRGNGGIFCAGGDLKAFREIFAKGADAHDDAVEMSQSAGEFFAMIAGMPQLTVALIEGAAMAGGFGLACCCDIMVADENARFALTETQIGISPAQIAPYVIDRVGRTRGKQMMILGSRFDGKYAHTIHLVDELADANQSIETIEEGLKQSIKACAPDAVAVTKELVAKAGMQDRLAYTKIASEAFTCTLMGDEGREGVLSFLEKRKPGWTG